MLPPRMFLYHCWQVERHRCAAKTARAALAASEQQLKELSKEAAKADKDRCAGVRWHGLYVWPDGCCCAALTWMPIEAAAEGL
jgi:hypothetical protein